MTSPNHPSGTDRLAEVAGQLGFTDEEIVVNLQGDEPLMPPVAIRQVADILMQETSADLATLCTPITSSEEMRDPNVVKVVAARTGSALYFSRAPIPHHRDGAAGEFAGAYRHVGIYGYRVGALRRLAGEAPCELEGIEKLEQLRALWLGMRIQLGVASEIPGPGVDTETDLEKVSRLLAETVFLPE
jgi:3-deoxy-manno-octulosonate cytidylyltransferase (CMP-KDO synthetase)